MVQENIINRQINVDLLGGDSPFIPYSSYINKSLEQEVQSIVTKVDSNKIAEISEFFSEQDGKEGWYDNGGIRFSLFDLCSEDDNTSDSKNNPMVRIQDQNSIFSNELKEMFELISKENRDILHIRRRPVEQGQQESHWVIFYFFIDHNKKNILFIDTQNPSIGEENSFRREIDSFLVEQNCNLYISSTKIQSDDYSCGPIVSEITRVLWNNHEKVKEVLSQYKILFQYSGENREKVALDPLMDNHFKQLSSSFSTSGSVNYGNVTKEFNAASIRTAHFATALCIGLEKLPEESCDEGTKKSIKSIRSCFINNSSNVAWFNEQIKKIFQGEYEMPEIQNFENSQETATDASDVKVNDNTLYPVEQQTSGTICTAKSSEYENDDDQASSPECSKNTFQNQYLEKGLSLEGLEHKISLYEGINLTLHANLSQYKAQLEKKEKRLIRSKNYVLELKQNIKNLNHQKAQLHDTLKKEQTAHRDTTNKASDQLEEKERKLIDLRNRTQELEQVIETLNHQEAQLKEEMSLVAAQKLEQEESFEQAQQKINNLTKKFEGVIEDLNGKLKHAEQKSLSEQKIINNQSRKQTNYASASFVLAGMFAVGASLTPYLAVCITLAVAASVFLIAGGCCLYKANTALNDVKADQVAGVVDALNCNS